MRGCVKKKKVKKTKQPQRKEIVECWKQVLNLVFKEIRNLCVGMVMGCTID